MSAAGAASARVCLPCCAAECAAVDAAEARAADLAERMARREAEDRARDLRDFSFAQCEAFDAAEAEHMALQAASDGSALPLPARKHGDDTHSPNVCVGDPFYNLARDSRAPQCDCRNAMHLHLYGFVTDSTKQKLLKMPEWYDVRADCEECLMCMGETRWACPDLACKTVDVCGSARGKKKDHVLQICTKCVGFRGIVTCGVCGDEARARYRLPCKTCSRPLCHTCHFEWTRMCARNRTPRVTCPFCRCEIDGLVPGKPRYRAGGEPGSTGHDDRADNADRVDETTDRRRERLVQLANGPSTHAEELAARA